MPQFCIFAHIDHASRRWPDRLLPGTGTVRRGTCRPKFLDNHGLERERGITISSRRPRK